MRPKAKCDFLLNLQMFQGCGPCASPTRGGGGRRRRQAGGGGRQTGLFRLDLKNCYPCFVMAQCFGFVLCTAYYFDTHVSTF